MSSTFDARGFVRDFVGSMNAKDPETLLRHYAENAELKDPTLQQAVRGKAAIRKNFEQWSTAFSELDFTVKDVIEAGNKVAIHFDAKGRHTGELEVAPGEHVPATNKLVRMEVAEFLTIGSDGRISKDETLFDVAGMLAQLGLMPSPHAAPPADKAKPGKPPRAW